MAMTDAERQQLARQQVTFANEVITHNKIPDTRLSKQHSNLSRPTIIDTDAETITLAAEEEGAIPEEYVVDKTYADFCQAAGDSALSPDERFLYTLNDLAEDLRVKIFDIATANCRGADGGPAFHFRPMTEAGVAVMPDFNCSMDFETWKKCMEDPQAMFQEMKLRSIALSAFKSQNLVLYNASKTLDVNQVLLCRWVHHIAALSQNQIDALKKDLAEVVQKSTETGNGASGDGSTSAPIDPDSLLGKLQAQVTQLSADAQRDENEILDLRNKLQEATDNINYMVQQARGRTPGASSSHSSGAGNGAGRSVRVDGPPVFYNDVAKDTVTFEYWYDAMKGKIHTNADHYNDDETAKMTAVKVKLGGEASKALLPYIRESNPARLTTYQALMEHLWNEYFDHTQKEKAEEEFQKLIMKPEDPFQGFRNAFVRLAGETEEDPSKWKGLLRKKIPDRLALSLVTQFLDEKIDFNAICQFCQQIDLVHKMQTQNRKDRAKTDKTTTTNNTGSGGGGGGGSNNRNRNNNGNNNNPSGNSSSGGNNSNNNGRSNTFVSLKPHERNWAKGKISEREAIQFIAEQRCFNCRNTGHRSRDCTITKPRDTPSGPPSAARLAEIAAQYGSDPSILGAPETSNAAALGN